MKRLFLLAAVAALAMIARCDDGVDDRSQDQRAEADQPADDQPDDEESVMDPESLPTLRTDGALRNINLHNDYSLTVSLEERLSQQEPLNHAIGALEGLSGEITVYDDTVYLSHAGDEPTFEAVAVDEVTAGPGATILFGVRAQTWKAIDEISGGDLESLEQQLQDWRTARGIDGALAFRIVDPRAEVRWHVVDGERIPKEGVNSCEERKEYAHQFLSKDQPVRIIGLFTTDHTGVVVDHTTSIHAHVITEDGKSGHVDELRLSDEAELMVGVK